MMQIKINGVPGAGKFALVDSEDFFLLSQYSWYFREGYAVSKIRDKEVRMHRMVLQETDPDVIVDHINRNRLDNRRSNLRRYNAIENANNRSDNVKLSCFGEEKTIAEWSRDPRCCVSYTVLRARIYRGIPTWAAILSPKY